MEKLLIPTLTKHFHYWEDDCVNEVEILKPTIESFMYAYKR